MTRGYLLLSHKIKLKNYFYFSTPLRTPHRIGVCQSAGPSSLLSDPFLSASWQESLSLAPRSQHPGELFLSDPDKSCGGVNVIQTVHQTYSFFLDNRLNRKINLKSILICWESIEDTAPIQYGIRYH